MSKESKITDEAIAKYIKEHVTITTDSGYAGWEDDRKTVTIQLRLDDEIISQDHFYVKD